MAGYVTPYRGASGGLLPAGYAELLSQPGQYMAQGVDAFMRNFNAAQERKDKLTQADKVAKAMFDFYAPADKPDGSKEAHPFGMDKQDWNSLSARDRIARADAFVQVDAARRAKAVEDRAIEADKMAQAERQTRIDALKRAATSQDALANAMQGAGQTLGPVVRPRPITRETLDEAVTRNPQAVNAPNYDTILRAMETDERLTPEFIEDPVSGMRFMGRGRTTLPSGMNPVLSGSNLPDVPGYTPAPTGRGGYTWLKTPSGELDVDNVIKLLRLQQEAVMKDYNLTPEQMTQRLSLINGDIEQLKKRAGKPKDDGKPSTESAGLPTATNPKTGEKMVLKDGQWQPLK